MIGILCEKPSAARNFAYALGGNEGIYNGEAYKIVASVGHIYEFKEPVEQVPATKKEFYEKWDLSNLPWSESDISWRRSSAPRTTDVRIRIETALRNCDEIVIATDVDPSGEGELLAWEILEELNLARGKKISRMYFMDESKNSICAAFSGRKPLSNNPMQDPDYAKALFRSKWDYMSMQFSRAASLIAGRKLREGRLKSAMAVLVGNQLDAVANYKKEPFYQWRFKDEHGNMFVSENEPKSKSHLTDCPYVKSKVVVDKTVRKTTPPPKLIDLSALSAHLAGTRGIKAKDTLAIYQKMYEAQIVSYPRTEDKTITPEQFAELLPLAEEIAAVVSCDASMLTHKEPRRTHVKPQGAHGANRPGPNVPDSLEKLDIFYGSGASDIYKILAQGFLAMLCEDYEYDHQEGHLADYPEFKGSANACVSGGWKDFLGVKVDGPELLGETASPFEFEGFPPAPAAPTVKWLMKQLESRDIGTGATRTSTFATVSEECSKDALLSEKKGKLTLTDAGRLSFLLLPGTNIGSLEITSKVFDQMKQIAEGKGSAATFLDEISTMVEEDIAVMKENASKRSGEFRAPAKKVSGKYAPTGETIEIFSSWCEHEFTDEEIKELFAGREIEISGAKSKSGNTFSARGKLEKMKTKKGTEFWGFHMIPKERDDSDRVSGLYKGKKQISFKRIWSGHEFTDEEVKKLLAGEEISFSATSKAGKEYTATGSLKQQTYNGTKFWGFKADFSKKSVDNSYFS